ncbi:MAG TPA: sigma 54-interacting transcriptional regulator, partial [Pyrinomonadaceae bacterium]
EQIAECFANAADGGEPQILEYTLPMNGTDRWFEARMVRSGENILTVVRDITERMLSEEALRAERELLEALVGQLPASVGLIRGSDLRIQIVNPAYQAIAPGKEMLGKTMDELWPEAGQNFEAICRQVLETGEPYQVTDELTTIRRSPDGPLESGYFSWSLHRVRLPGGNGWGLLNTGWETTQRKQTEKTLSEREQLLKAMFGSLSSHVVVLDPSGTITYANRLWNEFAIANGCEVTTVSTGVNYLEVCQRAVNKGDESSRPVVEGIRAVITGRLPSFRVEYDCHSPDEKRWFLMQVDPMPPEHGGVVVVHTNVTDRKQAEQALRESEERFSKAFRANPQPMTISTLAEGRYLDVNDAFLEVSGYTRAEVIGHTSLELGIWERPENRLDFLRKINERGSVVNFESRFRTKDGSLRVLLYSAERLELGGVDCLIGASSDITDRQKAQDALRESRARLVLAYQAANMGTFEWNVQTGMNTWSAELEAMYGLERGTFPGTQSAWQELVHPEDREKALDGVNRAFKTGEPEDEEWRVTWPDGSVHWIYGRYQVFRTAAGVPERLTGINIDITNRKAAESAVRESEERFRNMADTVPAMIWVSGPDKLVTYVNQQWLDFTGRTMEEELGNGWAAGVHPDDFDRCLETYCNAFDRREPFRMEYRLKRADSRFRWVIDSASASFSPAGEFLGYIGSCVDITDRKESEESLRMAHEEVSRLKNQLQEENVYLQEEISLHKNFDEIIGDSDALKYVLFKIEQVAPTDSTVLITGETGTGKELVASAIHKASTRSDRPMVRVNCGALSQSLIESELFGHEKGAFTGASTSKIGRFELANGATIFLDEIGELPQESQVKLLRVIQEGEFERLGSARTIKVDVRIIAATNRNLDLEVKKGLFREDLWYRLNVFPITVPPLRQRREDIPVLVEHFVNKFARKLGKVITSISPSTMKSLRDYSWRGNIRELANVIERAVINSKGPVLRIGEDFLVESTEQTSSTTRTLEEMEREYILRVLEDRAWRIEGPHGAARLLGLNPSTLRTRLIKLGINRETVFKSDKEFGLVSS